MSKLLRLIVFDLDCTLWPFHVDMFSYTPPFKRTVGDDKKITDKYGNPMEPYRDVPQVLEHWSKRCEIAVASRTTYPPGAESLLELFGFDQYINYKEIYPGCKNVHFKSLRERSGIPLNQMLFFDDEERNIRDISKLGVQCVLVDSNEGVTAKLVEENVAKRFDIVTKT